MKYNSQDIYVKKIVFRISREECVTNREALPTLNLKVRSPPSTQFFSFAAFIAIFHSKFTK